MFYVKHFLTKLSADVYTLILACSPTLLWSEDEDSRSEFTSQNCQNLHFFIV